MGLGSGLSIDLLSAGQIKTGKKSRPSSVTSLNSTSLMGLGPFSRHLFLRRRWLAALQVRPETGYKVAAGQRCESVAHLPELAYIVL